MAGVKRNRIVKKVVWISSRAGVMEEIVEKQGLEAHNTLHLEKTTPFTRSVESAFADELSTFACNRERDGAQNLENGDKGVDRYLEAGGGGDIEKDMLQTALLFAGLQL